MAIIGMDIHRAFTEAIAVEGKTRRRLGRIDLRRDRLEAFATGLGPPPRTDSSCMLFLLNIGWNAP